MTKGQGPGAPAGESVPASGAGAPAAARPPGGGAFTLEARPAPGLYLVGWLLSVFGLGLALVGLMGAAPLLTVVGLLLLGVGLAAAAGYQIVARRGRPADTYRGPAPLLLFALVVVFVTLLGALIAVLTGSTDLAVDQPDVFLVGLLIQVVGYVGLVAVFVVGPRALTWSEIANARPGRRLEPAADVLFAGALMVPLTLIAIVGGGLLGLLLGVDPDPVLPVPESGTDVAMLVVAAVVLAPVGEEIFFRGFALSAWLRDLGERTALIRSAVFFALIHILTLQATPGAFDNALKQALLMTAIILPLGFVLGWLYLRRGLLAAIAGHATYNGIVLALFIVGQQLLRAG